MSTPIQPLTLLVITIAGWIQRDQQAAMVYLLEENKVLKARLCGRKLRLTDDERRRLTVKGKVRIPGHREHRFQPKVNIHSKAS